MPYNMPRNTSYNRFEQAYAFPANGQFVCGAHRIFHTMLPSECLHFNSKLSATLALASLGNLSSELICVRDISFATHEENVVFKNIKNKLFGSDNVG